MSGIKSWKDLPVASLGEATERHNCTCVQSEGRLELPGVGDWGVEMGYRELALNGDRVSA